MKKVILPILSLMAIFGAVNKAQAQPLSCGLTYNVKGGGFQVGLGYFKLKGTGKLFCKGVHGESYQRPVKITIGGHPISPRVGIGYLQMFGASGSIGFNGSMDDLYGHYLIADAQAAVGLGAGAEVAVQNPRNGLRFSLGVDGSIGLGAEAGLSVFTIEPDQC